MPRAERLHKCAVKELNKVAKASGQTSMATFLKRPHSPDYDQVAVSLDGVDHENEYRLRGVIKIKE